MEAIQYTKEQLLQMPQKELVSYTLHLQEQMTLQHQSCKEMDQHHQVQMQEMATQCEDILTSSRTETAEFCEIFLSQEAQERSAFYTYLEDTMNNAVGALPLNVKESVGIIANAYKVMLDEIDVRYINQNERLLSALQVQANKLDTLESELATIVNRKKKEYLAKLDVVIVERDFLEQQLSDAMDSITMWESSLEQLKMQRDEDIQETVRVKDQDAERAAQKIQEKLDKMEVNLEKAEQERDDANQKLAQLDRNGLASDTSGFSSKFASFNKPIQNNRVKTDSKQGGQPDNVGNTLDEKAIHEFIDVYPDGYIEGGDIELTGTTSYCDLIGVKITYHNIRYTFHQAVWKGTKKEVKTSTPDALPSKRKHNRQYNVQTMALSLYMCLVCNVPVRKVSDCMSGFFKGHNLAHSSVYEWQGKFAKMLCKPGGLVDQIIQHILDYQYLNVDSTTAPLEKEAAEKEEGKRLTKLKTLTGIFTPHASLIEVGTVVMMVEAYLQHTKRGTVLMHDHIKTYYTSELLKQNENAECNVHILRYLEGWMKTYGDVIPALGEFKSFLSGLNDFANANRSVSIGCSDEMYAKSRETYNEILAQASEQLGLAVAANKIYKKDITEIENLIARLAKYQQAHLLFLFDFQVKFSNNLAERGLRTIKRKQHIAMLFRSEESLRNYCVVTSALQTARNLGMNELHLIEEVLKGKDVRFDFEEAIERRRVSHKKKNNTIQEKATVNM